MEKEKSGIKKEFIFSNIFEKEEDCTDNPFVFEKFDLQTKSPLDDYPNKHISGLLLKDKSSRSKQATEKNDDYKANQGETKLKECYFIYTDDKIIQF